MPPKTKLKAKPPPTPGINPNPSTGSGPNVIHWHRTDLRLHDSPSLTTALSLSPSFLYQIWTWDPHYIYSSRVGPNRFKFLLDSQTDLSTSITALNPASKLLVLREAPQTVIPKLCKLWGITHLVFEKDTDAYARARDEAVIAAVRKLGVEVLVVSGRTLWDSDEMVKANGGKATMSITQVINCGKKLGAVRKPLPRPDALPGPEEGMVQRVLDAVEQELPAPDKDLNRGWRDGVDRSFEVGIAGPNADFAPPTLEELGMKDPSTRHRGGETEALRILEKVIADEDFTATFSKPATAPTAFEPQSTCLTSPHLHFGTLSVRLFWWKVQEVLDKYKGVASQPPTSLHGQLLFRDMYFAAQAAGGYKFAQTVGNPHCKFIPWHLPSVVDKSNGLITGTYEVDDPQAEEWFQRWKFGRTGFPWIDALMRQLRQEGWIHHLGRHAVACFLTRGGCYISWERGAEVFEELLIDHETACNVGNWQWLSCTAFYAMYYRCYSPVAFGQKWDKEGAFVRRYVPELKDLGSKYIYEPWKAPIADQRKAGIIVRGKGEIGDEEEGGLKVYPKPMFDFSERREICINGMKKAYAVGLHGDHPKVLDGSWKELFPDDGEGPTEGTQGGIGGTMGSEDTDIRSVDDDDYEMKLEMIKGVKQERGVLAMGQETKRTGGGQEGKRKHGEVTDKTSAALRTSEGSPRKTRAQHRDRSQVSLEDAFKKAKR